MSFLQYVIESGVQLGAYAVRQGVMKKVAPEPKEVDFLGQYLEGYSQALDHYEANLKAGGAPAQRPANTPSSGASTPSQINRPGCVTADEAAVALFHLEGLARGKGGFGVLRISKERLEKAAEAADVIQHPEIAAQYRDIAQEMPGVSTAEEAAALRDRLEPIVFDQSWALGQRCKGALTPQDIARIRKMVQEQSDGQV